MQINTVKVRLVKDIKIKNKDLKKGSVVTVQDIIGEDGSWDIERKGKVVATAIKHWAVQQLATVAGIKVVDNKILALPTLDNRMHTLWEYTVELNVLDENGEPTSETQQATEIGVGTADDNAGSEYMARKRAFDRAILDVLGLYDVYSDIEADALEDGASKPIKLEDLDMKERTALAGMINGINQSKTVADIMQVGEGIKNELATAELSENAIKVVRTMWQMKKAKLEKIEQLTDVDPL